MSEEDIRQQKINKIEELKIRGIDPFPHIPQEFASDNLIKSEEVLSLSGDYMEVYSEEKCYVPECKNRANLIFKRLNRELNRSEYGSACNHPHGIPDGWEGIGGIEHHNLCPSCDGRGWINKNDNS